MNSWIFPITLLPGIGFLIASTASQVIALSSEIDHLSHNHENNSHIVARKISQLALLTRALVGFYVSAGAFVLSGILLGLATLHILLDIPGYIVLGGGVLFVFIALVLLIIYSTRSVRIRKAQFINKI